MLTMHSDLWDNFSAANICRFIELMKMGISEKSWLKTVFLGFLLEGAKQDDQSDFEL